MMSWLSRLPPAYSCLFVPKEASAHVWLEAFLHLFLFLVSVIQPLHWVGVLLMLLGLVTMGVRIYAGRCGTSPQCASGIAVLTIGACLTAWLVCEGPLYADVKVCKLCCDLASTRVWIECRSSPN